MELLVYYEKYMLNKLMKCLLQIVRQSATVCKGKQKKKIKRPWNYLLMSSAYVSIRVLLLLLINYSLLSAHCSILSFGSLQLLILHEKIKVQIENQHA